MMPRFTHLHTHSEYSLLDGLSRVEPMVEHAKALGMDSLGITDHGNLHAAVEFYNAATHAGIKPIIGIEAYLAKGSRHDRTGGDKQPYHITLLAKDAKGYANLLQLSTKANLEGYYYKPRIDHDLLEKHSEGIIAFSGCLNGEVPRLLQDGRMDEAKKTARWFQDRFGGDFYLELQHHDNIPELPEVNRQLLDLHRALGIPLVVTNDVHYIHQDDHAVHDALLCVQTNSPITQSNRMRMSDQSYFLRSGAQMEQLFSHVPDAIANTGKIADSCNLKIDFSKAHLPKFPVPGGLAADDYLTKLCEEGLRLKFPSITEAIRRRLDYELDVIKKTHFSDYFLVVWQIASFARKNDILMGVRGSAAASLVLYCLDITKVDPLKYRLVFERFLNIERKEMPDIDMDFQDDRRDEVMNWVVQQYGADKVAQIVTFGTMGAKAVLRDVGRVQGIAYGDVDAVARLIPAGYRKAEKGQIKAWTIEDALELIPEFKERYDSDYAIKGLVDLGKKLEGTVRNTGTHAAGVVISDEPLSNYVPLQRPLKDTGNGIALTQYPMDAIAKLGLLKMDFLGLVNLTILQKCRAYIADTRHEDMDLLKVPLDDTKTFDVLGSGDTSGIFQLESAGIRRYIKELKPTSLGDLSAMIALYRPGPLEQIPHFIDSKHGRRAVEYPHPVLKDILEETYGIIVYQDQVLLVLQHFAGYTLGQADIVRKAMGKKIAELMQAEEGKFLLGAKRQGFNEGVAKKVWQLIEPFAGYAFNKAHSVSYALIAYWTAYLKANYPAEYMAALLTCFQDVTDKVTITIAECQRLGIPVLPPDINHSDVGFLVERLPPSPGSGALGVSGIRFGLGAIKNVGETAVRPLIDEVRAHGRFRDVNDFTRRATLTGINRRTLESLAKVGALEALGPNRATMALEKNTERILAVAAQRATGKQSGQAAMFDFFGGGADSGMEVQVDLDRQEEASPAQRALWEKELLGVSLSADRVLLQLSQALGADVFRSNQIDAEMTGREVKVAGRIATIRMLQTKKDGRSFAIASLEDLSGTVEVTTWPQVYAKTAGHWKKDKLLVVKGKVQVRNDQVTIVCNEVSVFDPATLPEVALDAPVLEDPEALNALDPELSLASLPTGTGIPNEMGEKATASSQRVTAAEDDAANNWGGVLAAVLPSAAAAPAPVSLGTPGPAFASQPNAVQASSREEMLAWPASSGPSPSSSQGEGRASDLPPRSPATPRHQSSKMLSLSLRETDDEEHDVQRLHHVISAIKANPGNDPVRMTLLSSDGPRTLDLPRCNASAGGLIRELEIMLGPGSVRVA